MGFSETSGHMYNEFTEISIYCVVKRYSTVCVQTVGVGVCLNRIYCGLQGWDQS